MMKKAIVTIGLAATVLVGTTQGAEARPMSKATVQACKHEDGSGQPRVRVCVWDAKHMGNGTGKSLIITKRNGHKHYKTVSHKTAHRLINVPTRWGSRLNMEALPKKTPKGAPIVY